MEHEAEQFEDDTDYAGESAREDVGNNASTKFS